MADMISPLSSTMQPPPLPQHPKKRQYTKKEAWMKHRPMIEGLWKDLGYREIVRLLKEQDFNVTEKQLKDRIRSWGLGKNVNESKRKFIVRKQTQQRANGKDCIFRVCGKTVEPEKISRWQKRDNNADTLLEPETTAPSPAASTPSDISYTPFTPPISQNSEHMDVGSYQEVDDDAEPGMPIPTAITQQHIHQLHSTTETNLAASEFEKFLVDDLTTFEGRSPAPFTAPSTPAPSPSEFDHPIAPQMSSPTMDIFRNSSPNLQNSSSRSETHDDSSTRLGEILPEPISGDISKDSGQHYSSQTTTLRPKNYTRYRQKDEDDFSKRYKDLEFRYGANHPATLDTGARLANVYVAQGRLRAAEALCKQIALAWLANVGENDVRTLRAFNLLTEIFIHGGQYPLAERLSRQIFSKAQSCMDDVLLDFQVTLARCCHLNGATSEAEALFWKVLRTGGQFLPPDSPLLIDAMCFLSLLLRDRDELVESEKILRVILQSEELSSTPGVELHRLQTRAILGDVLNRKGAPEAHDMLRRTYEDQIRILGPEHIDTLETQTILASAIIRAGAGASSESISLLEDAVQKMSRTLGDKHPLTIQSRRELHCLSSLKL